MTNESTLKKIIREEMERVSKKLVECEDNDITARVYLKVWLQSLQRIDDVCKNRNRY